MTFHCEEMVLIRVSTGIPGYGLRTEMIRKFFSISIMEKVPEIRNSGTIFSRKLEISGIFQNKVPELHESLLNLCKDNSFQIDMTFLCKEMVLKGLFIVLSEHSIY